MTKGLTFKYNQNPLATEVHLDDRAVELLKEKILVSMLEEIVSGSFYALTHDGFFEARNRLQEYAYDDEPESEFRKQLTYRLEESVQALKDIHHGDCVAAPTSCMKCHAEELLGIDTLPENHTKNIGSQLNHIFDRVETIDEAISLAKIMRWKTQNVSAEEYMESFFKYLFRDLPIVSALKAHKDKITLLEKYL